METAPVQTIAPASASTTLLGQAFTIVESLETRGVHPAVVQVLHLLASAIEAHRAEVVDAVGTAAGHGVDAAVAELERT